MAAPPPQRGFRALGAVRRGTRWRVLLAGFRTAKLRACSTEPSWRYPPRAPPSRAGDIRHARHRAELAISAARHQGRAGDIRRARHRAELAISARHWRYPPRATRAELTISAASTSGAELAPSARVPGPSWRYPPRRAGAVRRAPHWGRTGAVRRARHRAELGALDARGTGAELELSVTERRTPSEKRGSGGQPSVWSPPDGHRVSDLRAPFPLRVKRCCPAGCSTPGAGRALTASEARPLGSAPWSTRARAAAALTVEPSRVGRPALGRARGARQGRSGAHRGAPRAPEAPPLGSACGAPAKNRSSAHRGALACRTPGCSAQPGEHAPRAAAVLTVEPSRVGRSARPARPRGARQDENQTRAAGSERVGRGSPFAKKGEVMLRHVPLS